MRLFIAFLVCFIFYRCANQTSPNGGPQDKKPPELISTNPSNNQRNFKGEKIELEFNEYIKLKDPLEEIMISPTLGKETKFIVKKNKLVVVPKQKMKENTTYSISFRDAVQDINEGNPIFNLRLAFSTGDEIDSLRISGNVYQLFKDEAPDKITVALYQSDTFNIFTHQPIYFTRTDKKGNFTITNLKAGEYRVYAFDDKSKNLRVESKSERFGYLSKKFNPADTTEALKIPIIQVDARPIKITSIRNTKTLSSVRLSKLIDTMSVTSDYLNYFVYTFGSQKNEIMFYGILKEQPEEDSIKINLHLTDSVGNKLDTIAYLKSINVKAPKENFTVDLSPATFDRATKTATVTGNFSKPLAYINYDSIFIQIDSTHFQAIDKEHLTTDTLNHTIEIKTKLDLQKAKENEKPPNPIFVFGKGAFVSIENDSSKSKTNTLTIEKDEELGSLSLNITTKEPNYLVQLISSRGDVLQTKRNIKTYNFAFLQPQEYKLRIIVDKNNNQKWDAGNFQQSIEPEPIILYKAFDGKTSIPVRANWEVGPLLIKF